MASNPSLTSSYRNSTTHVIRRQRKSDISSHSASERMAQSEPKPAPRKIPPTASKSHVPQRSDTNPNMPKLQLRRESKLLKQPCTATKLDMMVECAICKGRYRTPKTLNCQHTFCLQCLVSILENQSETESKERIRCAVCRQETKLPIGGLSRLPGNITIEALLDLRIPGSSSDKNGSDAHAHPDMTQCSQCGSHGAKLFVCMLHCNQLLCMTCHNSHGKHSREATRKLVSTLKLDVNRLQFVRGEWESRRQNLLASHKQLKMDSDDFYNHAIDTLKKMKAEVAQSSDKLVVPYAQGMEAVVRHVDEHIQDIESMVADLEDYVLQKGQIDQWHLLRTRYEAQMKHSECQNVAKNANSFFTGDVKYKDRLITKVWYRYGGDDFDTMMKDQKLSKIAFMSKPFSVHEGETTTREANY